MNPPNTYNVRVGDTLVARAGTPYLIIDINETGPVLFDPEEQQYQWGFDAVDQALCQDDWTLVRSYPETIRYPEGI